MQDDGSKQSSVKCYRLVVRAKDLDDFQNWAIQTTETISEFQPSVSMVLSTGAPHSSSINGVYVLWYLRGTLALQL